MKFIKIEAKSFLNAINWATRSFDPKDSKAYVALTVDSDGSAYLSHSNYTSHMKAPFDLNGVDLDGEETYQVALDGRFMQRLTGAISQGELTLKNSKSGLILTSSAGKFTIPTLNSRITKTPEVLTVGSVSAIDYFDTLSRLAKVCDPASAGLSPALGTVNILIDEEEEEITMMATDRWALSEAVIDFTPGEDLEKCADVMKSFLFTYESAILVNSKEPESIELIFEPTSQKFGYRFNDGRIALFGLKQETPLSYGSIKEGAYSNVPSNIWVSTKDLQKAITAISNLDYLGVLIKLKLTEDSIEISDSSGSNKMEIDVISGEVEEDCEVVFVRAVINKIFAPVSTAKVAVKFSDNSSPFVFEPVLDNDIEADNIFVLALPKKS